MSVVEYIAFPKELKKSSKVVPISDLNSEKDKYGLFNYTYEKSGQRLDGYVYYPLSSHSDGCFGVSFVDKGRATFTDYFKNPFIYKLHKGHLPDYQERLSAIFMRQKWQELKELNDKLGSFIQQMLYESLNLILDVGEFVEICTIFSNHIDYNYGQPTSERIINLSELLISCNILYVPECSPTDYRYKVTIHKTGDSRAMS